MAHYPTEIIDNPGLRNKSVPPPETLAALPARTLRMTVEDLAPAQSTGRHRQSFEMVLYVLEGEGTTFIEDEPVEWKAGDVLYIPVWTWHYHWNASVTQRCRLLRCDNAPLLQSLGGIALREETR